MIRLEVKHVEAKIGKRKGQTLYYAQQVKGGKMTLPMVEEQIVKQTALSRGDVRSAIAALTDIVNDSLLRGDSVDLGDLGSFRVSVGTKRMDKPEDVNASTVKSIRIVHSPRKTMKEQAKKVSIEVDNPKAKGAHLGERTTHTEAPTNKPEHPDAHANTEGEGSARL